MIKKTKKLDDLGQVLESIRQIEKEKQTLNVEIIQNLRKKFKSTVEDTKKTNANLEKRQQRAPQTPNYQRTRAGAKREAAKQAVYADSKWVNKGIDDSQERYTEEEVDWLKKRLEKVKEVRSITYDQLRYLIIYEYFDDLKKIKSGELKSTFHDRYIELRGKSKSEIFSEVKTNLFTNEQRDYINGLLLGAFKMTDTDANGDIQHSDINYVEVVMLFETTIRIVKLIHKLESDEETLNFMVQKSRDCLGLEEDS